MDKSIFHIAKMDCPSEEQIIRMKLAEFPDIQSLVFDITARQLTVYHNGNHQQILSSLNMLNLGTSIVENIENTNELPIPNSALRDKKILWQVLIINFLFFAIELTTGLISNSMGLVSDSLDMLADSFVYALALYAVSGTILRKKRIAKAAGYFQLALAIIGFAEVIRRFVEPAELPNFQTMIIVSALALVANVYCLRLLQKSQSKEAHMQASMIFTSNDIIINVGVIIAGTLVFITNTKYPDLIIGTIVFVIVAFGAMKILKLAKK